MEGKFTVQKESKIDKFRPISDGRHKSIIVQEERICKLVPRLF